jgi:DNA-binding CsgD family transcriptional regulator
VDEADDPIAAPAPHRGPTTIFCRRPRLTRYGQAMAVGMATERLLDRASELDRIADFLAAARGGSGAILVFEGPGGIGKTRLVAEAQVAAARAGMTVLAARGTELERELPFGIVRQMLDREIRGDEDLFVGAAALARPVFEPSVTPEESATPADRSQATLHGLHWLCAGLAERASLLLAVDDAQWADTASLRFLAYLSRRIAALPIALLIGTRPAESTECDDVLAVIAREPEATVMRPLPLAPAAVAELLRERTGREPEPTFAEACREVTGGNPFLLVELARELRERGIEPLAERSSDVRQLGPPTVAKRVLSRVRALGEPAPGVARAIAVLGADAELRHLSALAGVGLDECAAAVDALARAEIVAPGLPPEFVHPVVRTAIQADIPAAELARLHARAAHELSLAGASAERIAGHLLAAEPAGDAGHVEALAEAARGALARGAPRSAVAYLRRALDEPARDESHTRVLLALGTAETHAGDPRAIEHLEAAVDRSEDPATRMAATLALGRYHLLAGAPGRAFEVFERAPAQEKPHKELLLEASVVAVGQLDVATAPQAAKRIARVRQLAEAAPDPPPAVFGPLATGAAYANEPAEQVAALARRAAPGGIAANLDRAPHILYGASFALLWSERYDEAAAILDEGIALAQASGSAPHLAALAATRAWLALRRGALLDAEADGQLALDAWDSPRRAMFSPMAVHALVQVSLERGQLEQATQRLASVDMASLGDLITDGKLIESRGRLRLAAGDPRGALDDLLAAGHHLLRAECPAPAVACWRSDAALAHHALGETDAARKLAAEEVELARAFGAPRALGVALRAQGLVEGGEAGVDLLGEAVEVLSGSAAPLAHAHALADLGAALRRSRSRVRAREHLRAALDIAHRHGATALEERVHVELLATGARPRRAVLSGVESLTASERRVAEMAARGMTNRDIAQALFVTQRTVQTHLTHAFRKLDIESRTELPAALGA